jgi:hypothetical protein
MKLFVVFNRTLLFLFRFTMRENEKLYQKMARNALTYTQFSNFDSSFSRTYYSLPTISALPIQKNYLPHRSSCAQPTFTTIYPVDNWLYFLLNSASIFGFLQLTSFAQKSPQFTHVLQHLVLTILIILYRLWVIGFIQFFLPVLFSCFFLFVSSFCMTCEFLIQRSHSFFRKP